MKNSKLRASTAVRHEAIYRRFCELVSQARCGGVYRNLYLSSFYSRIADEMGYSDEYVGRIVARIQSEQRK